MTKRFDTLGIPSTERSRRTYREMLFIFAGAGEFISGVIMHDETIRQESSSGTPMADALTAQGMLPGIKVDTGAKPLAGFDYSVFCGEWCIGRICENRCGPADDRNSQGCMAV